MNSHGMIGLIGRLAAASRASGTARLAVGLVWVLLATPAFAQSDIQPRDRAQTISHNDRPEPQVFHGAVWGVDTKSHFGATVTLSCGPFQNSHDRRSYVDGQLGLRLVGSQKKSDWRVRIAADRTNLAGGKKGATVMAVSEDKGKGFLELTVTFLGADVMDLVEGEYSTTVTGTITAH